MKNRRETMMLSHFGIDKQRRNKKWAVKWLILTLILVGVVTITTTSVENGNEAIGRMERKQNVEGTKRAGGRKEAKSKRTIRTRKDMWEGKEARWEDFPYAVRVVEPKSLRKCGGTVVAARKVLTAGHCCVASRRNMKIFHGPWGDNPASVDGVSAVIHGYGAPRSNFKGGFDSPVNDLCVITTFRKVPLPNGEPPNNYPKFGDFSDVAAPDSHVRIFGFGASEAALESKKLQAGVATVSCCNTIKAFEEMGNKEDLQERFSNKKNELICVGPGGAVPCQGDEGGGMFSRDLKKVYGVLSFLNSDNCDGKGAAWYTALMGDKFYWTWLKTHVDANVNANRKSLCLEEGKPSVVRPLLEATADTPRGQMSSVSGDIMYGEKVQKRGFYPVAFLNTLDSGGPFANHNGGRCTGVLYRPTWVLTAAHCCENGFKNARDDKWRGLYIEKLCTNRDYVPEEVKFEKGGWFTKTKRHYKPPKWDLCLIELEYPHSTGFKVKIAPEKPQIGSDVIIVGYGKTEAPDQNDKEKALHAAVSTVQTCPVEMFKEFQKSWNDILYYGICISKSWDKNKDKRIVSNGGDSGGPLLKKEKEGDDTWVVYGILSFGSASTYSYYTDVTRPEVRSWIAQVIDE